jgi:hypothetical protein
MLLIARAAPILLIGSLYSLPLLGAERSSEIVYKVILRDIPKTTSQVEVWIPLPVDDGYQSASRYRVDSNTNAYEFIYTRGSLRESSVLHARFEKGTDSGAAMQTGSMTMTLTFDVTRNVRTAQEGGSYEYIDSFKGPQSTDESLLAEARSLTQPYQQQIEKAEALFNHVVDDSDVKSVQSSRSSKRPQSLQSSDSKCEDVFRFVELNRALNIPSYFAAGLRLPPGRTSGDTLGHYCWASVFIKGTGWIPVDLLGAKEQRDQALRKQFFGRLDENVVELSSGENITLTPPQKTSPLKLIVGPYAEYDGTPARAVETLSQFKKIGKPPQNSPEPRTQEPWWHRIDFGKVVLVGAIIAAVLITLAVLSSFVSKLQDIDIEHVVSRVKAGWARVPVEDWDLKIAHVGGTADKRKLLFQRRFHEAKAALRQSSRQQSWSSLAASFLKFSRYVVGGVLAASLAKKDIVLNPAFIGGLGLLVLGASIADDKFQPESAANLAWRRKDALTKLIRETEAGLVEAKENDEAKDYKVLAEHIKSQLEEISSQRSQQASPEKRGTTPD